MVQHELLNLTKRMVKDEKERIANMIPDYFNFQK